MNIPGVHIPGVTIAAPEPSAAGLPFDLQSLPVGQLESLRFKANQIIESIQLLQRTLEMGGQHAMPAWPDILSKYNILLSQSHNLSMSLLAVHQSQSQSQSNASASAAAARENPFEKIGVHPRVGLTDAQLDNELIPLLRNTQTTEVLRAESDTVRHLAEHMATKGSLGVLGHVHAPATRAGLGLGPGPGAMQMQMQGGRHPEYEDVLGECAQIRAEHDERVDRATRAVMLLRDKYDWKARVAVEQEEPEELDWDPRLPGAAGADSSMGSAESPSGRQSNDSEEEEELEEVLGNGEHTPEGSQGPPTPTAVG